MENDISQDLNRLLRSKLGADLILRNGNIICVDPGKTTAEAVAVKNKNIIAIGSSKDIESLAGKNSEIIDLGGKTVLPGFIESHFHPDWYALSLLEVDLGKCATIDEVLGLLKKKIRETDLGKWVIGSMIPSSILPGKGELNRWKIDSVSPEHPVFIKSLHHSCCVNTRALSLLKIREGLPEREGWVMHKNQSGELTGVLEEKAWTEAQSQLPKVTLQEHMDAFKTAMGKMLEVGLTTIHDALADPEMIRIFQALEQEKALRMRVHVSPDIERFGDTYLNTGIHTGFVSDMLRLHQMKILQNTFSGATAALFEDYANDPGNRGFFLHPPGQIEEWVMNSVKKGWSVHSHVMGDRELDVVLTAYEKALDWYRREWGKDNADLRLALAHYGLYNHSLLKRTAASKIVVAVPPQFKLMKGKPGGIYHQRLGEERWQRSFPVKTLLDHGVPTCVGSDGYAMPWFDPMINLYALLDGCDQPWEVVTPYEAIQMYTINGAYSLFREREVGSIEIGKLADLVVLSENPLELARERIWDPATHKPRDLFVEYTIVGGKIEYCRD
jgi:predicted amidohydrolase YtcJ